ncbi:MAG: ATP-binding protein, partial [Anaerolineales bacterium]
LIVVRAEGNPFFIEEMVRMLADEGVIVQEAGRWHLGRIPGEITLPDTIQAVIAARIDHLPLGEKAVLQKSAVIGRTFWLGALRSLSGDTDVGDAIEALERKEFIQDGRQPALPGEREYSFKHVLIHEVAYGSLPRGARGRMHQQVGEWLERASRPRLSEALDLLAHHFQEAATLTGSEQSRRRAGTYLRQAAESAYRRYALDQAMSYAQAALALGEIEDPPAVEELLGDVLFVAGRLEEAEGRYRQALGGFVRPLDQARLHRKLIPTLGVGLRIDQAAQELAVAERLLTEEPNQAEEAALLVWKGRLAHHRMAYAHAIEAFSQGARVLEEMADRAGVAWSECFLASSFLHLGQYAQAFALARRAGAIAQEIRHPQLMALAYA